MTNKRDEAATKAVCELGEDLHGFCRRDWPNCTTVPCNCERIARAALAAADAAASKVTEDDLYAVIAEAYEFQIDPGTTDGSTCARNAATAVLALLQGGALSDDWTRTAEAMRERAVRLSLSTAMAERVGSDFCPITAAAIARGIRALPIPSRTAES
jgi:hypothetical protein